MQELKLKDGEEKGGENEIMDLFLATAGCKAIMKVSTIAHPTNLEDPTFKKISQIKGNMRPQKKVGHGRKNEDHVDETRNWLTNHKISTLSMKCE